MRRFILFLSLLVVLFSCAREDFTIDSQRLARSVKASVDSTGYAYEYRESLSFDVDFSNDDLKYSFRLTDPSGDLSWEGNITNSVELSITEGAVFPKGEWDVIYYADNGNDINEKITLSRNPEPLAFIDKNRVLKTDYSVSIREFDKNNKEIKKADAATKGYKVSASASYVLINYTDRFLNKIEVTQYLK